MFNFKKSKKGFTLIEILLVVGFIALAGIAIYVTYNKVQTSNSATTESRNLETLRAGIKNLYATSNVYTGVTNTVVNNSRITPEIMRGAAAADIVNSFGGIVTITSNGAAIGVVGIGEQFGIDYDDVPIDICSKLVTGGGSGFDRIEINGVTVKDWGSQLDVANTAVECSAAATSTLTFRSL